MPPPTDATRGGAPEPPADPEAWTDEEWLEWLRATDGEGFGGGDGEDDGTPTRMTAFTRRPTGRAIGAAMIGLRNAIYGVKDDEIVIVADAGGDPPSDPDLHDVHLDPDHPERSEVIVHPQRGADPADPRLRSDDAAPGDDPGGDDPEGHDASP